ncbi:MAG: hypothetical protein M0Q49_01875 [Porticoccaceae bacterium]|nr:hypothetical protein [Porticoccaceae bacterium]
MSKPTLLGTKVQIGFPDGATIGGTFRDTYDSDSTADIETIRDEDNNEVTAIVSNLGDRVTIEFTCAASVPDVKKGETLTVGAVLYLVEAANIRRSRSATRGTVTLYKPTAATWTTPGGGET